MKHRNHLKALLLSLIILVGAGSAFAQKRLLSDLPSGPDVSRVNISEAMLKMGTGIVPFGTVGPYAALIKDPKSMEIYACNDEKLTKEAVSKFNGKLKSLDLEDLLSAEEYGTVTKIYMVYEKDKKSGDRTATAMIIYNYDKQSVEIVVIHGSFNMDGLSDQPFSPDFESPFRMFFNGLPGDTLFYSF